MGSEVYTFTHHPKGLYVLGTGQPEEFLLQDDTYHYEWKPEGSYVFYPTARRLIDGQI
jgi:cleavage and polyadenylation specificity factor subunit 1